MSDIERMLTQLDAMAAAGDEDCEALAKDFRRVLTHSDDEEQGILSEAFLASIERHRQDAIRRGWLSFRFGGTEARALIEYDIPELLLAYRELASRVRSQASG